MLESSITHQEISNYLNLISSVDIHSHSRESASIYTILYDGFIILDSRRFFFHANISMTIIVCVCVCIKYQHSFKLLLSLNLFVQILSFFMLLPTLLYFHQFFLSFLISLNCSSFFFCFFLLFFNAYLIHVWILISVFILEGIEAVEIISILSLSQE